jgi:hypothetical protein
MMAAIAPHGSVILSNPGTGFHPECKRFTSPGATRILAALSLLRNEELTSSEPEQRFQPVGAPGNRRIWLTGDELPALKLACFTQASKSFAESQTLP